MTNNLKEDILKNEQKEDISEKKEGETKKGKEISVDPDVLNKMLRRLEKVEEENALLRKVSDKGRLSKIENIRSQGKLVKNARISFLDDKAIIGWKKIKDDVYFDQDGRLHEEQTLKIYFNDKTSTSITYREFSRNVKKYEGEVITEAKDKDGNINYTILFKDGREYNVDIRFIN